MRGMRAMAAGTPYVRQARRPAMLALVLFLGPGAGSFAVESGYLALTIVRAEPKTRDRIV